jgi:hypothetical protein
LNRLAKYHRENFRQKILRAPALQFRRAGLACEQNVSGGRAPRQKIGPLAATHTFVLRLQQFWKGVLDGKFLRIIGEDSRDQRIKRAFKKFFVQSSQNKLSHAIFHAIVPGRHKRFARQGKFCAGGKKAWSSKIPVATMAWRLVLIADNVTICCLRVEINLAVIFSSDNGNRLHIDTTT